MSEAWIAIRRGWQAYTGALGVLLLGGLLWTVLNAFLQWLFIGPALFGLCLVALKVLRGRTPTPFDSFAALSDPGTSLVAGWLFLVPFSIWGVTWSVAPRGAPLVLTLALFVYFGVFIFLFPLLADTRCSLVEGVRRAFDLADRPPISGSRVSGLVRQLLFASPQLVAVFALRQFQLFSGAPAVGLETHRLPLGVFRIMELDFGVPVLFIVVGPIVTCLVTAWYWGRARGEWTVPREAASQEPAATPESGA